MSSLPSDVIEAIQTYGEPELDVFLSSLCGPAGPLMAASLDSLLKLADAVAKMVQAKNELSAMQAAVKGADAIADEAEAAALEAAK